MTEYIDREAALAFQNVLEPVIILPQIGHPECFSATKDAELVQFISAIPAADVVPVVHGKWIWDDEGYHCSECFSHVYGCAGEIMSGYFRYCPSCGADMREVDNADS